MNFSYLCAFGLFNTPLEEFHYISLISVKKKKKKSDCPVFHLASRVISKNSPSSYLRLETLVSLFVLGTLEWEWLSSLAKDTGQG